MAMTNYEMDAIAMPPLSKQLDQLTTGLTNNPRRAQQMANVPSPTLDALVAQRVLNETSKQRRNLEEQLYTNRAGNPETTVNDDLKMQNVSLAKDLTNLEMDKAGQVGALARQQQQQQQQQRPPSAGIGAILPGNRPPMGRPPMGGPTGGVNTLPANNMRGMPSGGITQRPPMPMPTARGAEGGLVAFKEGDLVSGTNRENVAASLKERREVPRKVPIDSSSGGIEALIGEVFTRRKTEDDAARTAIKDRVAADKGFTSDAFINRLLAFGGAENLAQGLIQSGRSGEDYQRRQEARTQQELDRISKRGAESEALVLQSLLNTGQLGLEEQKTEATIDISNKEFALKRDRLDFDTETKNKEINLLVDKFNFDVGNEEAKRTLEKLRIDADTAYKEAMADISRYEADTKRDELAVRLAAHRNDYIRQVFAVMSNALPSDIKELEAIVAKLVKGFEGQLIQDLKTMGVDGEYTAPPDRVTDKLTREELDKAVQQFLERNQSAGGENEDSSANSSDGSAGEGIAAVDNGRTNYQAGPLRATPEEMKQIYSQLNDEKQEQPSGTGIAAR